MHQSSVIFRSLRPFFPIPDGDRNTSLVMTLFKCKLIGDYFRSCFLLYQSAPEIISCFTGQIHNILTWCPDSVASRLTGKLRGFESLSIIRLKLNSYKFCHPNEYVVSLIYVINSAIRINMWSG